eukprot:6283840-Pyramimonas_sp.AAC.1
MVSSLLPVSCDWEGVLSWAGVQRRKACRTAFLCAACRPARPSADHVFQSLPERACAPTALPRGLSPAAVS